MVARKPWLSKSSRANASGRSGKINRCILTGRELTMSHRLYLSFWDICLDNLPCGTFEHITIAASEASALIHTARASTRLRCVSKDDLLAPYRERERRHHEELCAVLRSHHDFPLQFDDFLLNFDGEDSEAQSIAPLELAELHPGERLLVVTCAYRLADRAERDVGPEHRFLLADDSIAFHLITALRPREALPAT